MILSENLGEQLAETGAVFANCVAMKHLEYFRTVVVHDGDSCQQCWAQAYGQDWLSRRGHGYPPIRNDVVKFRDYGAENPEAFQTNIRT